MRLGVLDVGSNTVHLLVVDAHPGARPLPAYSHKAELRLAQLLDADGAISAEGVELLARTVAEAMRVAEDKGAEDVLPFATSAVREAANGEAVLARVEQETGVRLTVLSGEDESRLTFLAVRRWFGWSAGKLLVLDIGGGSLEVGYGMDEYPDAAVSLPLGAGRLTSGWLPGDPPSAQEVRALRRHVRTEIARTVAEFARLGPADHAVGTSKTFRQLARIAGAARSADGLYVQRVLRREALEEWVPRLAEMAARQRANLPGVSEGRAGQLLAGALVAEAAMDLYGVGELEICPWALREGVILRKLDVMAASIASASAGAGAGVTTEPPAPAAPGTGGSTRTPQGPVANATPYATPYAPPAPAAPQNSGSGATVARRIG